MLYVCFLQQQDLYTFVTVCIQEEDEMKIVLFVNNLLTIKPTSTVDGDYQHQNIRACVSI